PSKGGKRRNILPPDSRLRAGLSGKNFLARMTCVGPPGSELKSSCADLIRASTSFSRLSQGVDGRVEPGQDEMGDDFLSLVAPDFSRTALRLRGNDDVKH